MALSNKFLYVLRLKMNFLKKFNMQVLLLLSFPKYNKGAKLFQVVPVDRYYRG